MNNNNNNNNNNHNNDDGDGSSLRTLANRLCKRLDIGTAVLPKPLFEPDDDDDITNEDPTQQQQTRQRHPNGTIACCTNIDTPPTTESSSSPTTPTRYAKTITNEFNSIVIEHHLKWTPLCQTQPGPIHENSAPSTRLGRYDFAHVDSMVDWALERGMKVKGHVLVWHVTTPGFVEELEGEVVREELRRHIFTTVGHFRGRIKTWDVVNESLAPDGTLADNIFLRKLGPSYIADAFHWAHQADPTAFLIYNDNKVEGCSLPTTGTSSSVSPNADKADGFYNLLKDLVQNGVPVHGAGMQAHFDAGGEGRRRVPTPRMVKEQIRRIGDLGLKVNISEMDVRVSRLEEVMMDGDDGNGEGVVGVRDLAQRQIYHDILAAALTEPAFDGIWLWGFTDRQTWVKNFYYEDSPLIFDQNYQRKPCYYGLRDAIATMAVGGIVGGGVNLEEDLDEDGRPWGSAWMVRSEGRGGDGNSTGKEDGEDGDVAGDSRPDWLQS